MYVCIRICDLILLYNNKIARRFQMKQKKTKNNRKKIE